MKAPRDLRQISIVTNAAAESIVAALLEREFGQAPSVYVEAATGAVTVSVFWALPTDEVADTRAALRDSLADLEESGVDPAPARLALRRVKPQDWSESWKRHFKPFEISPALLVKPTWSRRAPRSGQAVVLLDPGLSFGTGQHATTRFCLAQIAARRKRGVAQSLLDMGCGTGILAIAAAKLGYGPIKAFDFDPDSVRIARENAALNEVSRQVKPVRADLTKLPRATTEKFDLVVANLMADLLIAERDRILARLKPSGALVLAGILKTQFAAVRRAYSEARLRLTTQRTEGEWHSGAFV